MIQPSSASFYSHTLIKWVHEQWTWTWTGICVRSVCQSSDFPLLVDFLLRMFVCCTEGSVNDPRRANSPQRWKSSAEKCQPTIWPSFVWGLKCLTVRQVLFWSKRHLIDANYWMWHLRKIVLQILRTVWKGKQRNYNICELEASATCSSPLSPLSTKWF